MDSRLALLGLLAASSMSRFSIAAEIDVRPLPLAVVNAFPTIHWTDWDFGEESGVPRPIRPILLTHAGDASGRIFVPLQHGLIHILDQGAKTSKSTVFLDISDKVSYDDKTNEEGLLGLAFHPRFTDNGEFFVYYTNRAKKHQNVVARYRVSKSNPNLADPSSEEIVLTLDKPFWNHDGGTIAFGPDGFLYIATGDGGLANDPFGNGQKLSSLLGKILRIDVDRKTGDRAYAIPEDNPFANDSSARGEIWAYGLRNVWRMAFDPATGKLWAGDVGQDTWEEIDLITKGGNYGWNIREALHTFVPKGGKPPDDDKKPSNMIDPIWEYHHDLGKSITGGLVYRGKTIPELVGAYVYADYVSGKMWALKYDESAGKVVANREIPLPRAFPVMSFGEDADGEIYFMTFSPTSECIYRLAPAPADAASSTQATWPTFRGPQRAATSPDTGLLTSWPENGPKLLWQTAGAGRGYSSLAIAGGRIYTLGDAPSTADDEDEYLLCFDQADGKQLWKAKTGAPWNEGKPNWHSSRSTPTVDGDRVFVVTPHGALICCSTAGQEIWRKDLLKDFNGKKADGWGYSESVLLDGDKLICTPGGPTNTMMALDRETGDVRWTAARPDDRGAGHASIVISNVAGTRIYVQSTGSGPMGVRADDGKLLWTYDIDKTTAVIPTPIVRDDLVFFVAGYNRGGALFRQVPKDAGQIEIQEVYPL